MEYPTQITVNDELVIFKRDWTIEERQRFERIFCAVMMSAKDPIKVSEAHKYAFAQMVMLDDFYKKTQITNHLLGIFTKNQNKKP